MKRASKIFSKDDRDLLHGILKGTANTEDATPISKWTTKTQTIMRQKGHFITKELIGQRVFWKNNDQVLWQTIFELVEAERPGVFGELKQKQAESAVV